MHPADARITAKGPLRIETSGTSAQIWLVMLVGAGKPSAGSIEGQGLRAHIRIEGKMLNVDPTTGRITCR